MHFSQKQLQNNQRLCHWHCQAQQQHWNSGDFVQHHFLSLSWSFFASFAPHCKIEEGFCIVIAMTELKLFAAWMTQRWKGVSLTQVHLVRGSQPAKLELHPPPLSPLHLTPYPYLSGWHQRSRCRGARPCGHSCALRGAHFTSSKQTQDTSWFMIVTQLSIWSINTDVGWISIINQMWTRSK